MPFTSRPAKSSWFSFGDLQAVAGKHQRRLDAGRRVDAHAERGLIAERHGRGLALRHQREARLRLVDAARAEGDGLQVARGAGRLEPRLLEVVRDVLGGLQVLGAAGLAAAHAVVGQRLDVREPAGFGIAGGLGLLRRRGGRFGGARGENTHAARVRPRATDERCAERNRVVATMGGNTSTRRPAAGTSLTRRRRRRRVSHSWGLGTTPVWSTESGSNPRQPPESTGPRCRLSRRCC